MLRSGMAHEFWLACRKSSGGARNWRSVGIKLVVVPAHGLDDGLRSSVSNLLDCHALPILVLNQGPDRPHKDATSLRRCSPCSRSRVHRPSIDCLDGPLPHTARMRVWQRWAARALFDVLRGDCVAGIGKNSGCRYYPTQIVLDTPRFLVESAGRSLAAKEDSWREP